MIIRSIWLTRISHCSHRPSMCLVLSIHSVGWPFSLNPFVYAFIVIGVLFVCYLKFCESEKKRKHSIIKVVRLENVGDNLWFDTYQLRRYFVQYMAVRLSASKQMKWNSIRLFVNGHWCCLVTCFAFASISYRLALTFVNRLFLCVCVLCCVGPLLSENSTV